MRPLPRIPTVPRTSATEEVGMDNEEVFGPIDVIVIGYRPDAPTTGEAFPIFLDLVDRGIIQGARCAGGAKGG
jgi:hypothetical protein